MQPHQERKLDDILIAVNQLIPQVADTKTAIGKLDDDVNDLKIANAQQSERMAATSLHVDNLGKKVRDHVEKISIHQPIPVVAAVLDNGFAGATQRWKFIGAVTAGLVGLMAVLAALYSFIPGGHH